MSQELTRARRDVLLGHDPDVRLMRRAVKALGEGCEENSDRVSDCGTRD